jgi:hypothetical protein
MWLITKSRNKVSSRKQIEIKEVKDGILILPGNEYRTVIETSSVNLELKSETEQDVLIDSFQNFLNSLSIPLQILIRVREVDIDSYIEKIKKQKETEKEKIYRTQIDNYSSFVEKLVSGNKILSRKFYVVIPYKQTEKQNDFKLIKEQINMQKDLVIKSLEKIGVKTRTLNTLEVLELFYNFYNPSQIKTQGITDELIISQTKNYV